MIPAEELRRRAGDLGVPESQIARDHLISHVLHALSQMLPQRFVFFDFTPEVLELTRHLTGYPSSPATLGTWIPPATLESWNAELGQQAGDLPAPSACLQIVLKALDRLAPARE